MFAEASGFFPFCSFILSLFMRKIMRALELGSCERIRVEREKGDITGCELAPSEKKDEPERLRFTESSQGQSLGSPLKKAER
ncbi:hypothetical protein Dgeo_0769 [Deinococcus geothermalis DSM 11300]|uniref:Uncharacterized protein n=1 Tax=Deinococcus geothermalis (strain DSM 11300 / CIP 105573 / AG-3a) TaxID=319795 RepID=Q1J0B3_DEIGD|nr:hypothetical protein Dgeo_0769 [Deinococcus geothermalis DSM 11300]